MMKIKKKSTLFRTWVFLFLVFFTGIGRVWGQGDDIPFQIVGPDDHVVISQGETQFTYNLYARVPEGHFLYKEKTHFEIADSQGAVLWTGVDWPETTVRDDPFLNKKADVWTQSEIIFPLHFEVRDASRLPAVVSGSVVLQGCSQDLCFRPVRRTFRFEVKPADASPSTSFASPLSTAIPLAPQSFSSLVSVFSSSDALQRLFSQSFFVAIALSFLGGVLTDFTPCVLPLVPLILLFIGVGKESRARHNALLALSLVVGMSVTYIVLGLIAVALGWNLGFVFQSRAFLAILTLFFVAMALSLFDVFALTLPHRLQTRLTQVGGKGVKGSFLVGLTVGFVALPCVGPVVGALLVYVAASHNWVAGASYLLAYGLGMGALFILASVFYGKGRFLFERSRWTVWIKKILGLVFLALAVYYGSILVKGFLSPAKQEEGWYAELSPAIEVAQQLRKPILVDFRADWCLPCLEMESMTFKDERVLASLKNDVIAVRLDCTQLSEACEGPAATYHVIGFPTLLFLDPDGKPVPGVSSMQGYVDAKTLFERLQRLKQALHLN